MRFKKFVKEDWFNIKECVRMYSKEIDDNFFKIIQNGINTSIVEDDKVLACGGVVYVKKDIAEAWIKVSAEAKGIKLLRIIRDGFKILIESMKGIIIQSYVLSGFKQGEKLAEFLGFYKTVDSIDINGERYDRYVQTIS